MIRFSEPVLVLTGDDRQLESLLTCLHVLRGQFPGAPLLVIPRSGPIDRLGAFAETYRFTILETDFSDLDLLSTIVFSDQPGRDRLRRLAVFDIEAPAALCLDSGHRLPGDPRKLLGRLFAFPTATLAALPNDHLFLPGARLPPLMAGHVAWSAEAFVIGGPKVGSAAIATALRHNLVAYLWSRGPVSDTADGMEGPLLNMALAALGVPILVAEPDWPVGPDRSRVPGAALDVAPLRTLAPELFELNNGGRYARVPPHVFDAPEPPETTRQRFEAPGEVDPGSALLARLGCVTVFNRGVVMTADGALVAESLIHTEQLKQFGSFRRDADGALHFAETIQFAGRRLDGPYVVLKQEWDGNYGHWLAESLPRLAGVAEKFDLSNCRILIGDDGGAMALVFRDTLALLGVAPEQLVTLPDAPAFVADVIYPAPLTRHPMQAPRIVRFLQDLGDRVPEGLRGPERLYVSRNRLTRRRLLNEWPLFLWLSVHGYVFVQPEALRFADQVRLFRHATHVIGNLGAALINLAFAPPGVKLLALTTEFMQHDVYWELISHLGGEYWSLHGQADEPESGMQSNFTIEPSRLAEVFAQFDPVAAARPPAPLPAAPMRRPPIGLFCKSFRDDFPYLRQMLETLKACNVESLPFALSLPEEDIPLFCQTFGETAFPVLADHELTGLRQMPGGGWTYQQVVKLCADRSGIAENLFMLDSDHYFIRPFGRADFLDDDGTPFTCLSPPGHTPDSLPAVLTELDGGAGARLSATVLRTLRSGRAPSLTGAPEALAALCRGTDLSAAFGHPHEAFQCMHGTILQARVLRTIRAQPPARPGDPPGTVPQMLINASPWEYIWYTEYLLASDADLRVRPPQVFHIASAAQLQAARKAGLTDSRLARRYCAVAMAARHFDEMRLGG